MSEPPHRLNHRERVLRARQAAQTGATQRTEPSERPSHPAGPSPRGAEPRRTDGRRRTPRADTPTKPATRPNRTARPLRRIAPPPVDVRATLARAAKEARGLGEPSDAGTPSTPGDLTDLDTLRALLRRHGLRPNKAFGQHLLVDREALDAIVSAADLQPSEQVLEVGSGTGVLTLELAARAQRVVAVEIDRAILPVLRETTAHFANVEIIPRDLLDIDPSVVFGTAAYKLVANLPYYITALTLRHFLEAANAPRVLVVMVQREVAQRITAAPGDMSLLGLSVQFYGTPRLLRRVPAASFYPPPKVDSAIVRVDLTPPPLQGAERDRFFGIAHAGFAEKRKQLHNSLGRSLHLPQATVTEWLAAAQIDPMRRAETLSLADWVRLTHLAPADVLGREHMPEEPLDSVDMTTLDA